ncbi:MAG: photosynthetic complex putative assembly protein PuhB [Gemmatimonadales bacterium]
MTDDRTWIRGVGHPLPPGEHLVWQGAPAWQPLARHALHLRALATYFALIILYGLVGALRQGLGAAQILVPLATQVLLAGVVLGAGMLYAWFTARNTVYAITDRRVVIKAGLVLPITINIPFRLIDSAWARRFKDGTGQISLGIRPPDRLGFVALWPHVRPWRLRYPEPMLRGLTDTDSVAALLHQVADATAPVTLDEARPVELTAAFGQPSVVTS